MTRSSVDAHDGADARHRRARPLVAYDALPPLCRWCALRQLALVSFVCVRVPCNVRCVYVYVYRCAVVVRSCVVVCVCACTV